jgi:GNAT superfamily N-acetyltransferase
MYTLTSSIDEVVLVAADHPSLDADTQRFLEELRSERRFFGPTGSANPKPFPSLIDALAQRDGFRLAAVECGRVIGLARVDWSGELYLAVVADRRRHGVGTALGRAAAQRAEALSYPRLVLRSTRRSRAAGRMAEHLGCVVIEGDFGRTSMILRSA